MIENYQIVVIGGGSTGILTISELMTSQYNKIAWIDPTFDCGELNLYKYMPANTKVLFQLKVANQSSWFKNIQQNQQIADTFQGMDPNEISSLGQSYEMFRRTTTILDQTTQDKVKKFQDEAIAYTQQQDSSWQIQLKSGHIINAFQVIFCVGGHNRDLREMIFSIRYPSHLIKIHTQNMLICQTPCVHRGKDDIVVIIGASHSGLLALKTLYEMKDRPKKIFLMYLDDLLFAEHNLSTNEIKYNYIGLKGDVATFTKKILQTKPSDIIFVKSSQQAMLDLFPDCTKVVTAVGFQRNNLGIITRKDGIKIQDKQIQYDDCMSNLLYEGQIIDGMYGGGIAFPEKVVDVSGLPGCAIGFQTQMNYVSKLLNSGVLRPRL